MTQEDGLIGKSGFFRFFKLIQSPNTDFLPVSKHVIYDFRFRNKRFSLLLRTKWLSLNNVNREQLQPVNLTAKLFHQSKGTRFIKTSYRYLCFLKNC